MLNFIYGGLFLKRLVFGILTIILMLSLSGCVGADYNLAPSSKEEVTKDITVNYDKFKKQTWISTPSYLLRDGFTDRFPVVASYRTLQKNDNLKFIQLYLKISGTEWAFFNEAVGEDGYSFKFLKIDKDVNVISGGGQAMALVKEHVALFVPVKQLEKMSLKNYEIKIYGKNREGSFVMPQIITSAFLSKISNSKSNKN